MRNLMSSLGVPFFILLSGCGATSPQRGTPVDYPSLTGNWALAAETSFVQWPLGGYITNDSGSVSGTIHVLACLQDPIAQDIPITGTVSSSGVLSATGADSTQSITFDGTVVGNTLTGGTYSMTNICISGSQQGPMSGSIVPSYSNTYTGTFISVSSAVIGTTIVASQTGPDSDGFYHLTGTANFAGSACFTSGTITASTVAGTSMSTTITTDNGSTVTFTGTLTNSTAGTITGDYQVTGGTCSGDSGTGTVSHS